jgi:hypothetical protein
VLAFIVGLGISLLGYLAERALKKGGAHGS